MFKNKKPLDIKRLDEANLNRLMWHGRHGFIIISANRSSISAPWNESIDLTDEYTKWLEANHFDDDESKQEQWLTIRNKEAEKSLLNDIKNSGYAFTKVFGGYHPQTQGGQDAIDSYEPSFVVYNHARSHSNDFRNWEDLKEFGLELCKKYKQDSVYIQAPNEAPVYMSADGSISSAKSSDNFKFNRDDEEYYTTTKRDKTNPQRFTADIQFESMHCYKGAATYNERIKRSQLGEVFLND
ncbi:MAG: hypothetical protein K2H20_03335 [Bacilli bacterium]|nr:hypothetical protein [Bacilli bacterium]